MVRRCIFHVLSFPQRNAVYFQKLKVSRHMLTWPKTKQKCGNTCSEQTIHTICFAQFRRISVTLSAGFRGHISSLCRLGHLIWFPMLELYPSSCTCPSASKTAFVTSFVYFRHSKSKHFQPLSHSESGHGAPSPKVRSDGSPRRTPKTNTACPKTAVRMGPVRCSNAGSDTAALEDGTV